MSAPIGRPTKYTDEIADIICERLVDGQSLRSICRRDDMPALSTVFRWMRVVPGFSEQYARAKAEQADTLADEILEIADDGTNDWVASNDPENAGYRLNGEHVQRSRLRIDSRKWVASKLKPKKYGDRLDMKHDVEEGSQLAELLAEIGARRKLIGQ